MVVVAEMSYRDVSCRFCHRREIGTVMKGREGSRIIEGLEQFRWGMTMKMMKVEIPGFLKVFTRLEMMSLFEKSSFNYTQACI